LSETVYLTVDDVIALHDEIVKRTGTLPSPLLQPGYLDSAIHRPQQLAAYEGADLIIQAVALAIGISQAQAFQDGNKRAAFAAADLFLAFNGCAFDGDPITFACWLICVAGSINNDDIDICSEKLGFDLVVELDSLERKMVTQRFESWLRSQVLPDGEGLEPLFAQ
jgi:death-on-curing protein